jgi:hypothetical protein
MRRDLAQFAEGFDMFVFGFNLPFGSMTIHPDGKEEAPPHVAGFGFGWSRDEFQRRPNHGSDEPRAVEERES